MMARPSFAVTIAWILLGLSALYAATFSHLLYVSLIEQVFAPPVHLPRYAGPPHYHNAVEWILIVVPAVAGWLGVIGATAYLVRQVRRSERIEGT